MHKLVKIIYGLLGLFLLLSCGLVLTSISAELPIRGPLISTATEHIVLSCLGVPSGLPLSFVGLRSIIFRFSSSFCVQNVDPVALVLDMLFWAVISAILIFSLWRIVGYSTVKRWTALVYKYFQSQISVRAVRKDMKVVLKKFLWIGHRLIILLFILSGLYAVGISYLYFFDSIDFVDAVMLLDYSIPILSTVVLVIPVYASIRYLRLFFEKKKQGERLPLYPVLLIPSPFFLLIASIFIAPVLDFAANLLLRVFPTHESLIDTIFEIGPFALFAASLFVGPLVALCGLIINIKRKRFAVVPMLLLALIWLSVVILGPSYLLRLGTSRMDDSRLVPTIINN